MPSVLDNGREKINFQRSEQNIREMVITMKYIVLNTAIVQYLPQYASAKTAPIRGVR